MRQPDGKIVAVGSVLHRHPAASFNDFALARYNPNGSLDTSFSGDGKQTTEFGDPSSGRPGWRSKATARSSRSATAGRQLGDFALARYNPDGSLDTSFSGDGKQTTDFGGFDHATRRWRSRATARSSQSASAAATLRRRRLRARPL